MGTPTGICRLSIRAARSHVAMPHPLLSDDKNLSGANRWFDVAKVKQRSPEEQKYTDQRRNHDPNDFRGHGLLCWRRHDVFRAPPVLQHEVENCRENADTEKQGYARQDEKSRSTSPATVEAASGRSGNLPCKSTRAMIPDFTTNFSYADFGIWFRLVFYSRNFRAETKS